MQKPITEKTKNIYITTNVQCNLRCIYCYEDKSGNQVFDLEDAKEKLKVFLGKPSDETYIINLHGGEPFLVFDRIKELCEWAWEQNFPQKFIFFATTNGTKVHGEIKEWLYKHRHHFTASLSYDGTREMQNMNRSNSADLIDIDFFSEAWPRQGVKMTVSPLTIETLADGVIYLHSKGVPQIDVNLAYMVNWDDPKYVAIYYREMMKLADYYKEHPELRQKCALFDKKFSLVNTKDAMTRRWCGVGVESGAYSIDGKEYPCHLFFENVCGKEKSESWRDIDFTNPAEYITGECASCPIYPLCPTCYASNYIERGHIGLRDKSLCRLEKIRTLVVAMYDYDRIVNSKEESGQLSIDEINKRLDTLAGIEKIADALTEYKKIVEDLS